MRIKKLWVKGVVTASAMTALALLAFTAPSWAQTPNVNPRIVNLATPNGCVMIYWLGNATKATMLRGEGRCLSGLADGEWVYSVRNTYNFNDAETLDLVGVRSFKEGQAVGVSVLFTSKNAVIVSVVEPPAERVAHLFSRLGDNGESVSLSVINQKIDQAVAVSRQKNLSVSQAATAKKLAKQWNDDRQGLFAKWVEPGPPAQSNQAGSNRDDPKTTGGGARGG